MRKVVRTVCPSLSRNARLGAVCDYEEIPNATLPVAAKGRSKQSLCEKIETTGGRLAVEKICMAGRQWKGHREGQRADLERCRRSSIRNQHAEPLT